MKPMWILVQHRAAGSSSVHFGPFNTLEEAQAYGQKHGFGGYAILLHPPIDNIDWGEQWILDYLSEGSEVGES